MSEAAYAADDFVDCMIREFNFEKWEIFVLNEVRFLSFKLGRMAAPIHKQADLAMLTGIPENKISIPIESLKHKGVLQITRAQRKKGAQEEARGYRYAIVIDSKFWNWTVFKRKGNKPLRDLEFPPVRRRFELTPELEALRVHLISLELDDPEPKQPDIPQLAAEKNLVEALQEASTENLTRHDAGSQDRTDVMPPVRSEPTADGQFGEAGDNGNRRGSSDARSVPGHQASRAPEYAARVSPASTGQQEPPLKGGHLESPPITGGSPGEAVTDETSLKGRLAHKPPENQSVYQPPFTGAPITGGCFKASEVLKPSMNSFSGEVQFDHFKTSETSKEGECRGETKPPVTGSPVKGGQPRAPGAKVSFANEDQFMEERIRPLLTEPRNAHPISDEKECVNWGGWIRANYRRNPRVMLHAVDNLDNRLDSEKPIEFMRGAWLHNQFKRLKIAYQQANQQKQP